MESLEITASMLLIGAAIAVSGIVGVLQPPGHRGSVLLALLAGAGVGIAGLALGSASVVHGSEQELWRTFFRSSIAGFLTVLSVLALAWTRAHGSFRRAMSRRS